MTITEYIVYVLMGLALFVGVSYIIGQTVISIIVTLALVFLIGCVIGLFKDANKEVEK